MADDFSFEDRFTASQATARQTQRPTYPQRSLLSGPSFTQRQRPPPEPVKKDPLPAPPGPSQPPPPQLPPPIPPMEYLTDEDEYEDESTINELIERQPTEPLLGTFSAKNRMRTLVHTHVDGEKIVAIHETIDITVPRSNFIFGLEVTEMIFFGAQVLIAYLVLGHDVAINNYIYLIVGSILALIILALHIFNLILYTRSYPDLSARHIIAISITCAIAAVTQVLTWFMLGRWIIAYGFCCGTSQNQPNPLDLANYVRFYLSYATMFILVLIALLFNYGYSIQAHMYPETSAALIEEKKRK